MGAWPGHPGAGLAINQVKAQAVAEGAAVGGGGGAGVSEGARVGASVSVGSMAVGAGVPDGVSVGSGPAAVGVSAGSAAAGVFVGRLVRVAGASVADEGGWLCEGEAQAASPNRPSDTRHSVEKAIFTGRLPGQVIAFSFYHFSA